MSADATYSVFCDAEGCLAWEAQAPTAKQARRYAKGCGWARQRWDGRVLDVCPVHAGKPCSFASFGHCEVHDSYRPNGVKDGPCSAVLDG